MSKTSPSDLTPAERQKIIDFLSANPVGVLATVDADGDPHASTIYVGVDADLNVSFTTKRDTTKYKNIAGHDRVMLTCFDAANQAEVQVSGPAIAVTDPAATHQIYHGTLRAAETTGEDVVPPVAKMTGEYVAFSIQPDNIWLSDYGWGNNFVHALKHASDADNSGDPA